MPASSTQQSSPPRLLRRFAVFAGVALIVATGGAFLFVRHYSTSRAERTAADHTRFIADSILVDKLRRSDFQRPVGAERRAALDRLSHEILRDGALRMKLYGAGNRVVYSSDHALIGSVPPDTEEVEEALHGSLVSDVTTLNAEGGSGPDEKVLEAYVPVRFGGSRAAGVFELYSNYAPIADDAKSIFLSLAGGILVLLVGLYLSCLPILRRMTRMLFQQMREIRHKAYHDGLTDLPNRALFNDQVRGALAEAEAERGAFAVMLIDLDRFKEINDSLGHQRGDELLEAIAGRLPNVLRRGDSVARLGGDEFGVLARHVDGPTALALAERVQVELCRPHVLGNLELEVEASVGIALYPAHGRDVDTLLRHADVAMYRSKEVHVPALYDADHDDYSPARLALIGQLRQAIANRELVVHYQPQHDLETGKMVGVEALVRWQHPELGLLPPDQFIPVAERTGLIRPLTRYVTDSALGQIKAWQAKGLRLNVAVNVTGRDLLDLRFPVEVAGLLRKWDLAAERLELEITENTVLTDPARAYTVLSRLYDLGVAVAIDDFGTGNSSLGYLMRLPIGVIKVDRSFVTRMSESEEDALIVRSTVDLGHNLGLKVVAEGVETDEVRALLRELGCDMAQGYHLGRPVPASKIGADGEVGNNGRPSPPSVRVETP